MTDRVSGRTERRGYMQELEREKTDMMNHIRSLEKKLQNNGFDVKPWHSTSFPADPAPNASADNNENDTSESTPTPQPETITKDPWAQPSAPAWTKDRPATMSMAPNSHHTATSRPADAHLGVGTDQAPLSSIKGTSLSILGSTIDIGSLDVPDMDEPPPSAQGSSLYNKSVQALLQSSMNINQPLMVKLPPRQDAFTYAEWYFVMIHPFHPVLHKPSFMALVSLNAPDALQGQKIDSPCLARPTLRQSQLRFNRCRGGHGPYGVCCHIPSIWHKKPRTKGGAESSFE